MVCMSCAWDVVTSKSIQEVLQAQFNFYGL
jgi:hypothetical protein